MQSYSQSTLPALSCVYLKGQNEAETGKCGLASHTIYFTAKGGKEGAWYAVVQEAVSKYCYKDCDGNPTVPKEHCTEKLKGPDSDCYEEVYWEAFVFQIKNGRDYWADFYEGNSQTPNDYFHNTEQHCVDGIVSLRGFAKVVSIEEFKAMNMTLKNPLNKCMQGYSTLDRPANWNRKNALERSLDISWACCCEKGCPKGPIRGTTAHATHKCKEYKKQDKYYG